MSSIDEIKPHLIIGMAVIDMIHIVLFSITKMFADEALF